MFIIVLIWRYSGHLNIYRIFLTGAINDTCLGVLHLSLSLSLFLSLRIFMSLSLSSSLSLWLSVSLSFNLTYYLSLSLSLSHHIASSLPYLCITSSLSVSLSSCLLQKSIFTYFFCLFHVFFLSFFSFHLFTN